MGQQRMKKCSSCGAEIPESAAYCDICGALCSKRLIAKSPAEKERAEKNKRSFKRAVKTALIGIGVCFAALIVLALISNFISEKKYERREKARDLTGWETVISPEAFEKLDVGMTYEEMVSIAGGEGKKVEDSRYVTTYMWPGEYYSNSGFCYVRVDFYDDREDESGPRRADYIEERDVLRGAEMHDTYKKVYDGDFSGIDTAVVTKEQVSRISEGMSYEKVCRLLGEGKLCRSSTMIDSYGSDMHETYVWKCRYSGRDSDFELSFENGILKYYGDWKKAYVD